jgi:hypothetical protein
MIRKELLLLLLPTLLFVFIAGESFFLATRFSPNERFTQKVIDKLIREARSGDYGPNPDILVARLKNAWQSEDCLMANFARVNSVTGWGLVSGVVLQVYVIFRVKASMRKRISKSVDATAVGVSR